jgi:hypothetical protein
MPQQAQYVLLEGVPSDVAYRALAINRKHACAKPTVGHSELTYMYVVIPAATSVLP